MRHFFLLAGLVIACENKEGSEASKSATATASSADIGDVLATVNGSPVGSNEFSQLAARRAPSNGESLSLEERKTVLDQLVIQELFYQQALKKGYDKDPKVKKVMVNALLREEVYGSIKNGDFGEEELKAYFEAHKEEFITPEKVQIYSILIKVNDSRSDAQAKEKADRLYRQLKKDPTKFRAVATEESENPYKRRGGDVGYVPKEGKPGLDSAIVDKAFSMKVETLSEPFQTRDGWNIIYIPAKREQIVRDFAKMKGAVLRKVKNERMKENYDTYASSLKSGAQITTDEPTLEKVDVKSSAQPKGLQMPNGMQIGGGK